MKLTIGTQKKHEISRYIFMQFMEPLGNTDSSVDAAWDYVRDCWRADFLSKTKELSPTMMRFGGCFASYYHWKEGVGPAEKRPPMLNLAWDGIYSNRVGTDEFLSLCKEIGNEPLLVVNMESDGRMRWAYPKAGQNRLGSAKEAAEWVAYCNDPDDILRISHGRKDRYGVKYWQIGNETSYDRAGYKIDDTVRATREFAAAMRSVDNSIDITAWGDDGPQKLDSKWAVRMCEELGDSIDHIAFHFHFHSDLPDSPLYGTEYRKSPEKTWEHLMSACNMLKRGIDCKREAVKPYGKRLAMTEGHFMLPGRNRCELLSSWAAGVAYARCMNVIERSTDLLDIATLADFCGNRWQVNALMLPTPAANAEKAYLQPVGKVMMLFGKHIGRYALEVPESLDGADITASISEDGGCIYIHAVNPSASSPCRLEFEAAGRKISSMTAYEIAADPVEEITGLTPTLFDPIEQPCENGCYTLPAAGVAAIEIRLAKE